MAFEFGMDLTGAFAEQLGPVNAALGELVPLLDRAATATKGLDAAMERAAASGKKIKAEVEGTALSLGKVSVDWGKALDVERVGKKAEVAIPKVKRFHVEWGNLVHSFAGFRYEEKRGFVFNIAEGLDWVSDKAMRGTMALLDFGRRGVEYIAGLGKEMVRVAGDTQDLRLALELNLGKQGAAAIDELAESFSRTTRFDDDAIKSALLPLTEQGIKDVKLLDDLTTASVDIATRRKQGIEGVNESLDAFSKIALKGEVDARALRTLAIGKADYFKDLAGLLKVSVKRAEELTAKGKVAKQTLLSVALNQVAQRQGGALGIAALAGGDTMGATLQRLSDLPENLFKRLSDSSAMRQVQRVLDNIIDKLSGPEGVALIERFGSEIERAFSAITSKDVSNALSDIGTIVSGIVKSLGYAVELYKSLGDWADKQNERESGVVGRKDLGGGRGIIYDKLAAEQAAERAGVGWFSKTFLYGPAQIQRMGIDQLEKEAAAAGLGYARGFGEGVRQGTPEVAAAVASLASCSVDVMKNDLEIHSPSRVARTMGGYYGEGYALGIEDSVSRVERAGRAITAASAVGGDVAGPQLGFGAPGATIQVTNIFHVGAGSESTARELADELEPRIERTVHDVIRRAAAELG